MGEPKHSQRSQWPRQRIAVQRFRQRCLSRRRGGENARFVFVRRRGETGAGLIPAIVQALGGVGHPFPTVKCQASGLEKGYASYSTRKARWLAQDLEVSHILSV